MESIKENYRKYRWFFTSSGVLVVGGKSAAQNDDLLRKIKQDDSKVHLIMHTAEPGSPFTVLIGNENSISESDVNECAIFTACFSHAWKSGRKKAVVDIFNSNQIYKDGKMKTGTWAVMGGVEKVSVPLELVLTKQRDLLRAVPEITIKSKKDYLLKIGPGTMDKKDMILKIQVELEDDFSPEEILSALPAGGVRIIK